jgi:hypothetical protein
MHVKLGLLTLREEYTLRVRITGFLDFVHRQVFYKLENTTFRKLDVFPSSGEGEKIPTQLGPLERANLNHWTGKSPKNPVTLSITHHRQNPFESNRLRVFENRVLRRIFAPERDEVTAGRRKLHNEELHNLYSSPSIIRMIKTWRMK